MNNSLAQLVEQALAEAGQIKQAHVEKTAAAVDVAPETDTGATLRKLASDLRGLSSNPSYAEFNSFLRGAK